MIFVQIPAGTLTGSEGQLHQISAFSLANAPVTWGEFREFVEATRYECMPPHQDPSEPVVRVSAPDAEAFCKWRGCRLPTEWEWEWACRAGGPDRPDNIEHHAWCYENAGGRLHPIKQKAPNAWGLYDMLGNCWEWTSSTVGSSRVLRGGGWFDYAYFLRGSFRFSFDPSLRYVSFGFRCASHPSPVGFPSESCDPLRRFRDL